MRYRHFLLIAFFLLLNGCMTQVPIKTVPEVNLKQFMGSWFVIGHIPTFIEKNAFNAISSNPESGNARDVSNMFDAIVSAHARRVARLDDPTQLDKITVEDVRNAGVL